jgi:hydrogenase maturation protease
MLLKPILILAYGNLSRGDDALAPLLLDSVQQLPAHLLKSVECLTDFQLQIEHALDLQQRPLVLFVDASVANKKLIEFKQLQPFSEASYTTHAMNPAAVMQVYVDVLKTAPPPCFLLTLQGLEFELGAGLSATAQQSLRAGCQFVAELVKHQDLSHWQALCDA